MSNSSLIKELRDAQQGTETMPVGTREWHGRLDRVLGEAIDRLEKADRMPRTNHPFSVVKAAWENYSRGLSVSDRELATLKMAHDQLKGLFEIFNGTGEGLINEAINTQGRRIDDLIERRTRK
jgi:hypothetical protein